MQFEPSLWQTQISCSPPRFEENAILVPSGENWAPASFRVEEMNLLGRPPPEEKVSARQISTSYD